MKMQFTLLSTVNSMAKQQVALYNNCTLRKECAMNVAVTSQAHYDASVLIGEQYLCLSMSPSALQKIGSCRQHRIDVVLSKT